MAISPAAPATVRRSLLFAPLLLSLAGPLAGTAGIAHAAATLYVSPAGSDDNPGTLSSPFRTISHCGQVAGPGDTCYVEQGTYHEQVSFPFGGTPGAPKIFASYNGAVTVDGADPVAGWSPALGYPGVYQATVPAPTGVWANQVFIDGKMANQARWPDPGTANDPMWPAAELAGPGTNATTVCDANLAAFGPNSWAGATLHIDSGLEWWANTVPVIASGIQTGASGPCGPDGAGMGYVSFDYIPDRGYADKGFVPAFFDPVPNNPYYLLPATGTQALGLLAPGQWFYDAGSSTLYLRTPGGDDPARHAVEMKQRLWAFDLSGVSNVEITGIGIFGASITTSAQSGNITLDSIYARYVSHFTDLTSPEQRIDGGTVHEADAGIQLNGPLDVLQNSAVAYSAGNDVVVNGQHDTVRNCLIEAAAYAEDAGAGVALYGAGNATVTRNTIAYVGSAGIQASAWGHRITYNNIHDQGIFGLDIGAGIYMYSPTGTSPASVISHNWVHDTQSTAERAAAIHVAGGGYGVPGTGIYFDLQASPWSVDHNVVYDEQAADVNLVGASTSEGVHGDRFDHNTLASTGPAVYSVSASFPGLDMSMAGSSFTNNIFVAPIDGHLVGAVVANNLTYPVDPWFVDPATHNYHLRARSPALGKGAYEWPWSNWTAGCSFSGC